MKTINRVGCGWWLGALSSCVLAGCPNGNTGDDAGDVVHATDGSHDAGADVVQDGTVDDHPVLDVPTVDAADVPSVDATDVVTDTVTDAGCVPTHVLVATSDSASAGGYALSSIATPSPTTVSAPSGAMVNGDHLVRASSCTTFDLRRSGFTAGPNSVAIIDPAQPFGALHTAPFAVIPAVGDAGMAQAADPVDVARVSATKAYVALYNTASIAIVDPSTGTVSTNGIDLSSFADADGLPEPGGIAVVGTHAFVALQQLDRTAGYTAATQAHLAVIDTTTDTLVDTDSATAGTQGITLSFANPDATDPHIAISPDGASLIVAEAGGFGGSPVGGIDVVDVATLHIARSITVATLGGTPISVEWVSGTTAWAAIETPSGDAGTTYAIVAFDYTTGARTSSTFIAQSSTYNYGWLRRAPDGSVWALDVTFGAPGRLFAFGPAGTAVTGSPFAIPGGASATSFDFVP